MSAVQPIPFDRLAPSRRNVRRMKPDRRAHRRLVASIRRHGVLQNLVVVPLPNQPDRFGVIAGRRRLEAVAHLVKRGEVAPDVPLPCLVQAVADATPVSLSENFQRESLHPGDEFVAFDRLAREGRSPRDIARHFGISTKRVRKLRRLANVAPPLLTRYRKGELTLEEIMAFAVTTDHEKQLACAKALGRDAQAFQIRRHLTEHALPASDVLARFVTVEAYTAAGGTRSSDLFEEREYLDDPALVRRLASKKLDRAARAVRAEGWKWVKTRLHARVPWGYRHQSPRDDATPDELRTEIDAVELRLEALRAVDEWGEVERAQSRALNSERQRLEAQRQSYLKFTDEQKQIAGACVGVALDGTLDITRGLVDPADEPSAAGAGSVSGAEAAEPDAGEPVISGALRADLDAFRQDAMRAALIEAPPVAADVLAYTVVTQALCAPTGVRPLCDIRCAATPSPPAHSGSSAVAAVNDALKRVPMGWAEAGTARGRYEAFCALAPADKAALVGLAVALTLSIEPAGRADSATAGAVKQLGLDTARWWRPDPRTYFTRVTRADLLDIGEALRGAHWRVHHAKARKGALVEAVNGLFHDEAVRQRLDEATLARIDAWLPRQMRD